MKLAYALPFVAALSLSSLAGCGGHKEYMHAQAVSSPDVGVQPLSIWVGGSKLWVRVNVQNNSHSVLVVNRDAVTAHLQNGKTVGRAMGSYTQHEPYNIMQGSFHPVYVEFSQEGFKWRDVGPVQIDFTGAVLKDGQPVAVPPLVAAP